MHEAYLISLLLAISSNTILIVILHTRTQRVAAIVAFILFLVCINIWAIPFFIINAFTVLDWQFAALGKIAALGYIFIPVVFLTFSLAFTAHTNAFRSFLYWFLLVTPALIFLFFSWTTELIGVHEMSRIIQYEWGVETPSGKFFPLFVLWFDCIMLLAILIIIYTYRTTSDVIRKKQAFFVLIAVVIPLVIGTVTNGLMPIMGTHVFPAGIPLTSITAIIVVIAIFRYGLFDVSPFRILSSLGHGVITVDSKGKILQMNTVAEKIFGVNSKKVLGQFFGSLIVLQDVKGRRINFNQKFLIPALEKKKINIDDVYISFNKLHRIMPFSFSVSPIYSQHSVIGASIILRDIRKEKEREKHKDDFIGLISHELKTPITSIKAYNQILLKSLDEKNQIKQKQIVLKVDDQLNRLSRLIKDFLDVSRVQAGKLKLEKDLFKVDDLLQEIRENMKMAYKNRQLQIKGDNSIFLFADRDRLAQVLINLVTNAFKYSGADKKVVVDVKTTRTALIISVRDYGKGIAEEYHKKIFERFYQLDALSPENEGLGVGLYITANIIKAHGGKIWLHSKKGKGTTFHISLPMH